MLEVTGKGSSGKVVRIKVGKRKGFDIFHRGIKNILTVFR